MKDEDEGVDESGESPLPAFPLSCPCDASTADKTPL